MFGASSPYHDDDYDHYARDDCNEKNQANQTAYSWQGPSDWSEVGRVAGVMFDSVAVISGIGDDEETVRVGHIKEVVLRLIVQGGVHVN